MALRRLGGERLREGVFPYARNSASLYVLLLWHKLADTSCKNNYGEFATIKSQAGLNSYKLSVKEWVEKPML